jgi:hypothetical protein
MRAGIAARGNAMIARLAGAKFTLPKFSMFLSPDNYEKYAQIFPLGLRHPANPVPDIISNCLCSFFEQFIENQMSQV